MPSRHRLLSVFTTTLLLSLVVHLPIATPSGMDAAIAQPTNAEDQKAEADRLIQDAFELYQQGQFWNTLEIWQQVLKIQRDIDDRAGEGITLVNIGIVYDNLWQYSQALNYYQQALAILTEVSDREGMGVTLNHIGSVYRNLGQYSQALSYHQQALAIRTEVGDRAGEGVTLNNIGLVYGDLGQYSQALDYYQQALAIRTEVSDREGEGATLNNIGLVYGDLGQYSQALNYYQQALAIFTEAGNRAGEGITLSSIGLVYWNVGQYPQALDYYQQALTIFTEIGDREGEGAALNGIGLAYWNLGQYSQALNYYQQSLTIFTEISSRVGEGATLNNIGLVYNDLGQYSQALDYYQQALAIRTEIGDRAGEGNTLNNIGSIYESLGQYPQALDYYQQSLSIAQEIGDRQSEGVRLNNIGFIYRRLGQSSQALDYYQQSLSIRQEIGDREGEALTLNNLGYLLQAQNQPELAIVFFKQSVNRYETIRDSNRALSQELQESYTGTIEDTYRTLADLLLQQDRILEAQQVLDLLKVQELDDYLRGVRGVDDRLTILRPEQEILARYDQLQQTAIQLGQELAQLNQRRTQGETLTAAEEQRINELERLKEDLNQQFNAFLASDEIRALVAQLSDRVESQTLDLDDLSGLQDDLAQLNAVLLYPLILDDRLELVITTPNSPPLRRTVPVSKADLNRAISDFRQALRDPDSDPILLAQQLYAYLIEPIESDLAQVQTTLPNGQPPTIIYAPDAALRYIPLAALHDGEQWLVQRFRINNITAKSFTEFQSEPVSQPRVLAGAFADETISYRVPVDGQEEEFRGLPHAGEEVKNLADTLPDITEFLDRDFSWTTIRQHLGTSDIVHFATHAAFVPGTPQDSFILFGNGDRAVLECLAPSTSESLSCINNWSLENIDLVVLSACETGLPGALRTAETPPHPSTHPPIHPSTPSPLETGEEILGLGYQFQTRGARAVVASLWKVSDGGTQALMNAFYAALQQEGISKSEAIRQAQIALITGDYTALEDEARGIVELRQRIEANVPAEITNYLTHPYYWAPFILIGNGL